jgi:inner membrane protein
MSSFIGHTLAAISVYSAGSSMRRQTRSVMWLIWLIILSSSADIDYAIPSLRISDMRVTHSIAFCVILPTITAIVLIFMRSDNGNRRTPIMQAYAANLSHLVLDMLVGVTPLPLLWPFTLTRFRLPFGILPSAGYISPSNPLLYRNTLIEIGVLLPIAFAIYLMRKKPSTCTMIILIGISAIFAAWAFSLAC